MTKTTISTTINAGITLGAGNYGATLTIANSGKINAPLFGIYAAYNTPGTINVVNYGSVNGAGAGLYILTSGTVINHGHISSAGVGAAMVRSTLVNEGTVSGGYAGVAIANAGLTEGYLVNQRLINGTTLGVYLKSGDVNNTGTIAGGTIGLLFRSGYVQNSGVISGTTYGVYMYGASTTANAPGFINTGTISGEYAVVGYHAIALTLAAGSVLEGKVTDRSGDGLLDLAAATGSLGGIGGTITGFTTIDIAAGAAWTLEGSLAGLAAGQRINGFGTGDAIKLDGFSATSETLTTTGLVLSNGASSGIISLSGDFLPQNFLVTANAGTTTVEFIHPAQPVSIISTYLPDALLIGVGDVSGDVTITQTGSLNSPLIIAFGSTVSNAGHIGPVQLYNGSTLLNTGTILGGTGLNFASGGYAVNSGVIDGTTAYGVSLLGGTFINNGTVTGHRFSVDENSELVVNNGVLRNEAFVEEGVLLNNGTITATTTAASGYSFFTTIANNGLITGGVAGVGLVQYDSPDSTTIENFATVTGGIYGVESNGATIINAGLISGGTDAIDNLGTNPFSEIGPFNLVLTVDPGASFSGAVADHSGAGQLTLAGTSAGTLDMGGSFSGFSTIAFDRGASWTLEGAVTSLADGQAINGLQSSDTILLDGFSATADRFVAGEGLVLYGASSAVTLGLTTSYLQTADFIVNTESDGTGIALAPTRAGLISIISTLVTNSVSLGLARYADSLTITSTGTVTAPVSLGDYVSTLLNNGLIQNDVVTETYNIGGSVFDNNGTVTGAAVLDGDTINNTGVIEGSAAATTVINNGTISGGVTGTVIVNTGVLGAPANSIFDYGALTNAGTILGQVGLAYYCTLTEDAGGVFNEGVAALGSDDFIVLAGTAAGTLNMGDSFYGFTNLEFGPASWLLEGGTLQLAGGQTIAGFSSGDTLGLEGFSFTTETFIAGTGLVLSNATASETLHITGSLTAADLTVTQSGTTVLVTDTAPCFCAGTRIATGRGQIPVERLRVGDLVRTATNGFRPVRWIGTRSYDGRFITGNRDVLPVRIRRHALGRNIPSRDLFVSPDHAICEGGVLIFAWRLVNGVSITQAPSVARVDYFHIELDSHDIIFAHNTPVESFLDTGCRDRFTAATGTPGAVAAACLPRVASGYHLARVKQRIDRRAGITAIPPQGPLRFCVDESAPRLRGWAQDLDAPETPVELELLCGGQSVLRLLANAYREDLRRAGLGSGCHAFDIPRPAHPGPLTLRRALDGAVLTSPLTAVA